MSHDFYTDGELSDNEREILEQRRIDARQDNQKRMAWVAIISMMVYTIALFTPFIGDSRAQILTDIASLFYVAQAGVVGAYMGSEAMVNKARSQKNNAAVAPSPRGRVT